MTPRILDKGLVDFEAAWLAMRRFTEQRTPETTDEIWLLQHPPVFTLGRNARREHLLACGEIPVVQTDRGGQVTYHGPGQLVIYTLLDIARMGMGIRRLVDALEHGVIDALARQWGIRASARSDAPGVYVDEAKIASIGLRVRRGASYHGIAINIDMDLAPYSRIDPCGYPGLSMTQLRDLRTDVSVESATPIFVTSLLERLQTGTGAIADS